MTVEKKYKWALAGLIIMVALNAITLVMLWNIHPLAHNHDRRNQGKEYDRGKIHRYMQKEIGLSDVQIDSLSALRRAHYQEIRELRAQLNDFRSEYFDFILSEDAQNKAKQDSLINQLSKQYMRIEHALFEHLEKTKAVLEPEQIPKYKRLIKDSMSGGRHQKMNRGHRK